MSFFVFLNVKQMRMFFDFPKWATSILRYFNIINFTATTKKFVKNIRSQIKWYLSSNENNGDILNDENTSSILVLD